MEEHGEYGRMVEVRSAVATDLPALEALYLHLHADRPALSKATAHAILDQILSNPACRLLVCVHADALVASCMVVLTPNLMHGGRPFALVENVVTDAAHRRRGFGKVVVRAALDWAWAADAYNVLLMTSRADPGVHRFYEECGFKAGLKTGYVARAPDLV